MARRALIAIVVLAQIATIWITWDAWQVRDEPINLSWFASAADADPIPDFDFAPYLIAVLLGTLFLPRRFFPAYLPMLILSVAADQFRLQPQIIGLNVLLAGAIYPKLQRLAVWSLISMWIWAGIHKWLSPDWVSWISHDLLAVVPSIQPYYLWVAYAVIAAELVLALLTILRSRWAAPFCVGLHFGIVIFLMLLKWNESVIPWNIASAIIGGWWLHQRYRSKVAQREQAARSEESEGPKSEPQRATDIKHLPNWERGCIALLLVFPASFYPGWLSHRITHVLYSDNCPVATLSTPAGFETVATLQSLGMAFPRTKGIYLQYFQFSNTQAGDKLAIWTPEHDGVGSYQFFVKTREGVEPISPNEFFLIDQPQASALPEPDLKLAPHRSSTKIPVLGTAPDNLRVVHAFSQAGIRLLKREQQGVVYAIEFQSSNFRVEMLSKLQGLPNLEQIQLQGCPVDDRSMESIPVLPMLVGIGLEGTAVTEAALDSLRHQPRLHIVEAEGTRLKSNALQQFLERRRTTWQ